MTARARLPLLVIVLVVVAPAASALGDVRAGHSGWEWGNPRPQGHAVRALEFQGDVGYAVGDFGTVLNTTDAGATWSGVNSGVTADLAHVAIVDDDSIVVAGSCALRRSDDSGATFVRLPWTLRDDRCAAPIAALAFPTDQRGYVVLDDGTVLRSDDAGQTWSGETNIPAPKPTDIAFTSADTGVVTTSGGAVYRTADGGISWNEVFSSSHGLRAVYFATLQLGYAVGEGSTVLETFDGGKSWLEKGGDASVTFDSIRCQNVLVCLVTADTGDRVWRTTDAGTTFRPVPSTGDIRIVAFATASRAVAAGDLGRIFASDDAGASWTPIGGRLNGSFVRLRATSRALAFAAGRAGTVARTTDGGGTWQSLAVPTSEDVTDVSFANPKLGYALDLVGKVLRTVDGGIAWRRVRTGFLARPQAVLAPSRNAVLLIGPHGILRSSNGGKRFVSVRSAAARRAKLFEVDRAGRAIVAYGSRRIAMSTNGGKSWKRVARPRRALVAAVDFATPRIGFLLEQDGRLWRTPNRGRTWHALPGVGTDDGIGLAFSSGSRGYLVISRFGDDARGYLLRTADAGRTWRPQLITSAPIDPDGVAAKGTTDFALAADGSLFYTHAGGDEGKSSRVKITTPRRRLPKRKTIEVTGSVGGAAPGSKVLVGRRFAGDSGWDHQLAVVGTGGRFKTVWTIGRTSTFVAQWDGDDDQAGDGSLPLVVRVRRSTP